MFGHYRNTGIHRLNSYQDALNKFDNTKPIRGRTDVSRPMYPLGHRHRVDSFWILKCQLTQDVECYLYRTPVVTYKSNGDIVIKSDGWDTISTANFIGEVLGINAYIYDHSLCIAIYNENGRENYRVPDKGTLTLRRENGRYVYVSGAVTNVTHKVNRKAINQIRKQYKEFKDYARAVIKLRAGAFTHEEIQSTFDGEYPPSIQYTWQHNESAKWIGYIKEWISATHEDKHNDYYKALLVMVRSFGGWNVRLSQSEFDSAFNYMTLGFHRNEVLVEEVLPLGEIKKDNYGKYWRKGWGRYHASC